MADQRTSSKGIDFLVAQEGLVPYAYNDSNGNATFGVGHLLHMGPVTAEDRHVWGTKEKPHSVRYVRKILRQDIVRFETAVREAAGRELPDHQFDACVSLAFNIGEGGFRRSAVARWLGSDDVQHRARHAADAFLTLTKGNPLLLPRRRRERALFYDGEYE